MNALRGWCLLLGSLLVLAPASAQQPANSYDTNLAGPVEWNLGGTLNVPLGGSADRVDLGGGFTVGATFHANPKLGLQVEYGADWAGLKSGHLAGAGIAGHGFLQYFDANLLVRPGHAGRSGFYLVGGGGLYYRSLTVTRAEGTTLAPYCDPWLFYCSAVPVEATSVVGSRSRWDWGVDGGIGYTFGVAPPAQVYLEVRYHYIFGPGFTDSNGNTRHADGQYLPITLGVRF